MGARDDSKGSPMKKRLRRPSPALIISVIALVAALGGSAYAVKKIGATQLKRNAVTTKKIKNGAVTTLKIANGAVTNPKIANGAVTDAKIAAAAKGKAVAYANVNANGTVVDSKSRGITSAMIGKTSPTSSVFCFHDLPAGADTAVATGIWDSSTEFEGPADVIIAKAPLPDADCDTIAGTQFAVLTYSPSGAGVFADRSFTIAFFR